MIIVLDTNVLIGSIGKASPYRIVFDSFLNGHFTLALSNELLMEYLEVLQIKTSDEVAENIVMSLMTGKNIKLHHVYFRWKLITGDADDDKFYDLAVAANANYLVTNDLHFNVAKEITFPSVNIISAKDFAELLLKYYY